ncbi:hypothetical protein HispidOSU_009719 [Sigmodon hispidus]
MVSNSKTFYRVEEPRTWKEAMWYCQERYTDLADLQSVNHPVNIMVIYSYIQSTDAWIGLFYDVRISGLSWSSGSLFTIPTWSPLPTFQEGICATVYSKVSVPVLGAASCTKQKPFICYYDPAVGHRISLVSPVGELTTIPKEVAVMIGEQTFVRVRQTMSWLSALTYCRNHYTDLADLQRVTDKEGKETLQSITDNVDAWIGLYFNVKTNNLTWSSDLGSSIPEWLQEMPMFGQGLCAGLGTFSNDPPEIYALPCYKLKPFICFSDPSIGHRKTPEATPTPTTTPIPHELRATGEPGPDRWDARLASSTGPREILAKITTKGNRSESKKDNWSPREEHSFGILKADFTISTLRDPEEMKGQLLSEIQEVLKLALGHEEFMLKWVSFEVNKK